MQFLDQALKRRGVDSFFLIALSCKLNMNVRVSHLQSCSEGNTLGMVDDKMKGTWVPYAFRPFYHPMFSCLKNKEIMILKPYSFFSLLS